MASFPLTGFALTTTTQHCNLTQLSANERHLGEQKLVLASKKDLKNSMDNSATEHDTRELFRCLARDSSYRDEKLHERFELHANKNCFYYP